MSRRAVVALSLACLAIAAATFAAGATETALGETDATTDRDALSIHDARIALVAPNPVAPHDRGEFVVVAFPDGTHLDRWSLSDGESVVEFPDRSASGAIALTGDPENVSGFETVGIRGRLALSNAGETLELRRDDATIDRVTYGRAPEGERYVRTNESWAWHPAGATDFPVVSVTGSRVRAFLLPDSPEAIVEAFEDARDRVLLAGYTFASERLAARLCAASDRGVRVRVLLERDPVGGASKRQVDSLNRLADCGIDPLLIGGEAARYVVHHPKYAVIDDRALVLTENWKPSGTGGRSSRGWGIAIDDVRVADHLAGVFAADADFRDVSSWRSIRADEDARPIPPPNASGFPARFAPVETTADRIDVLLSPDNAETGIVALLDGASESIRIQQVSIGSREHPFVEATLRAARRGVEVRVLLSSAPYVVSENRAFAAWANDLAEREGLPLAVRLIEPRSRFEKTHAKGVVVDDAVVIGSVNWNAYATRENREVAVVVRDSAIASYYRRAFRADWRGGVWRLPTSILGPLGVAGLLAVLSARAVSFEDPTEEERYGYRA